MANENNKIKLLLLWDILTGKISDERFDLLAKKYEAEQTALKSEIVELKIWKQEGTKWKTKIKKMVI